MKPGRDDRRLARADDELRTLCWPELAELEERWDAGRLGSSTMLVLT